MDQLIHKQKMSKKVAVKNNLKSKKKASKKSPSKKQSTKKTTKPLVSQNLSPKSKNYSFSEIKNDQFLVIGIGASAGGLEALTQFLARLPQRLNAAIVIVQHLNPKYKSMLSEILSRITTIPVVEVNKDILIKPNHIYIRPPNVFLKLKNGALNLIPKTENKAHFPIDYFFKSLAEEYKNFSVGVIFSGTASDGTQGLQVIKSEGGLTFVQDPKNAKYTGMPSSAIAAGVADFVMSVDLIADEIVRLSNNPIPLVACSELLNSSEQNILKVKNHEQILSKIFTILHKGTQVDFSKYKRKSVLRRISRRLLILKIVELKDYVAYLEKHPEEVKILFAELLIHVTKFFRDIETFDYLKTKILPLKIKKWNNSVPFRIWVPGCATGEEVYSIAIACLEYMEKIKVHIPIQIFASDISNVAIQKARAGIYKEESLKDLSKERLHRFFEKSAGSYRISKKVRELCIFSKHNITSDPPFAKIDLISCRNVFIYFDNDLQKQIFPLFHYALNPDGILWLGQSESIGGYTHLFTLIEKDYKFFQKKNIKVPPQIQYLPLMNSKIKLEPAPFPSISPHGRVDLQKESDRISMLEYAPPFIVINEAMEILQVRGRVAPILELASGQASLNLLKMARPELISEIRSAMQVVSSQNSTYKKDGLQIYTQDGLLQFNLKIVPMLLSSPQSERYFTIFFEELETSKNNLDSNTKKKHKNDFKKTKNVKIPQLLKNQEQVTDLKSQLSTSHDFQKSLIEDLEMAQEDLTTFNEELQSTNEELQSTIEELETAKEELQSTNEELSTVNDELNTRNTEMQLLANDLVNLIDNIEISVIMVGPSGKINRFTPEAGKIFKLIPSDIGRLIGDLKLDVGCLNLEDVVAEVIKKGSVRDSEIQNRAGYWYHLQVKPYRTTENKIEGAVIILIDINRIKTNEEKLKKASKDASTIIEAQPIPLLVLDSQLRVRLANDIFYNKFQVQPKDTEGFLISELGNGQWNIPQLKELINLTITHNRSVEQFEVEADFPHIGKKIMLINAKQVQLSGSGEFIAILAFIDATIIKNAEKKLAESEEKFRNLLESAYDGIMVVNKSGDINYVNQTLEKMFGYKSNELLHKPYSILMPSILQESHIELHQKFLTNSEKLETGRTLNIKGKRKNDSEIPISISLSPVQTKNETFITFMIRDISDFIKLEEDRKKIIEKEQKLREIAENANRIKDEFLATLSHELRTPLTTILGWVQVLLNKEVPTDLSEPLCIIERSAHIQGQLINDLLDVSRIQSGKLILDFHVINLVQSLKDVIESVENLAKKKSIVISTELAHSICNISADPCRLQQIFWNLLTNAIKFTPINGQIEVVLATTEVNLKKVVQVKIKDTGIGIKPEFIQQIFNRFSQEDSSTTRTHGGLGLGLSIVRSLVDLQNGKVSVESKGLGQGAMFTVEFPIVSIGEKKVNNNQLPLNTRAQIKRLDGKKILIVDDCADNRLLFSVMLQSVGAEVKIAESVAEAMLILEKYRPNILLSDISMPGEDGYSLLTHIREKEKNSKEKIEPLPIVAITAYASAEDIRRVLDFGFSAHIAKPVVFKILTQVIAEVLKM